MRKVLNLLITNNAHRFSVFLTLKFFLYRIYMKEPFEKLSWLCILDCSFYQWKDNKQCEAISFRIISLSMTWFEFQFSMLTILFFSFTEMRRNICAHSSFAGCGQAFKFDGEAAYWDPVCKNQCWKMSIFSWEAQDRCSSYSCSYKECQSGWLCGMWIKALD